MREIHLNRENGRMCVCHVSPHHPIVRTSEIQIHLHNYSVEFHARARIHFIYAFNRRRVASK